MVILVCITVCTVYRFDITYLKIEELTTNGRGGGNKRVDDHGDRLLALSHGYYNMYHVYREDIRIRSDSGEVDCNIIY